MKKILKIGLMLNPSIGYERDLMGGIAKYSNLHGPWSFYSIPGKGGEALPHWPNWELDGVFITDKYDVDFVLKKQIPCISILVRNEISGIPNVVPDDAEVGRLGARYFADRGFKQFAFCSDEGIGWAQRRYESFQAALAERGFSVYKFNVQNDRIAISERLGLVDTIKTWPKPMAVLAANDRCGRQVVDMCRQADVRVPEEVSVLGVDNDDYICALSNPPLSSITFNLESSGYDAARQLHEIIEGRQNGQLENIFVHPVEVFQRQSTSLFAVEDGLVAAAINFISRNEKSPMQVVDVAEHTGVAARALQKRFQQFLGRSIHAEIRRVRAEYIAKLLLETNMTVADIADAMGYNCDNHMSRFFKQVKGMAISQFRKQYGNNLKR
jgi:LacI family transcriptional regulator